MCLSTLSPSDALARWDTHADRLATIGRLLAGIAADMPCACGACPHCHRLAWLEVEMKAAKNEAVAMCNELADAGAYIAAPSGRVGIAV